MKLLFIVFIVLALAVPLASAQITIDSFIATPDKVLPGQDVILELKLENAGDEDIENVIVRLDLSQVPFAPLGSSTERAVDEIRDHRHETMFFTLRALPDAPVQIYKIPVVITHGAASTTSLIGVEVTAQAHLEMILDNTDILMVGEQGKVTLKFVNDGLAEIQFLKVRLREISGYEIVSSPSLYVGEIEVGDFETEEFTVIPQMADPILALDIEYLDAGNQKFVDSKLIKLKVYTAEEARRLGLAKNNWAYLPWLIGIIVVAILFIIYRKRKRKNAL